mmetsp:Transcript_2630/g.2867  ORF Transcript_2630/g.2867 Transcript_2630/m.2867 type:complete len:121 (+) Transcript_2630:93-455(+)
MRLGDVSFHPCIGHRDKARSVDWNASGTRLSSASTDKTIKLWSVEGASTAREITTLEGHGGAVQRVRFHPISDDLLVSAGDDAVRMWDLRKKNRAVCSIGEQPLNDNVNGSSSKGCPDFQ